MPSLLDLFPDILEEVVLKLESMEDVIHRPCQDSWPVEALDGSTGQDQHRGEWQDHGGQDQGNHHLSELP